MVVIYGCKVDCAFSINDTIKFNKEYCADFKSLLFDCVACLKKYIIPVSRLNNKEQA